MEYGRSAVAQTALLLQASALKGRSRDHVDRHGKYGSDFGLHVCPGEDIQPNVCLFEKAERARILKPPNANTPRRVYILCPY